MSDGFGSASLVDALVERRATLVKFFMARTGSLAEAEDIVQELFLKISQGTPEAEVANKAGYLYRLGLNLLVDRYRSDARARLREQRYVEATMERVGAQGVSDAPSPDDALDARQRLRILLDAVAALPPQCRAVFRMHKLEGRTHGEIASALGISRSAVEKHVILALRKLAGAA